jgi:hypothetical protein
VNKVLKAMGVRISSAPVSTRNPRPSPATVAPEGGFYQEPHRKRPHERHR